MSEYQDPYARPTSTDDWTNPSAGTQAKLDATQARLKDAYQAARERSDQILEQVQDRTRERPLEALGYAAGIGAAVGLVVGLLLGRQN